MRSNILILAAFLCFLVCSWKVESQAMNPHSFKRGNNKIKIHQPSHKNFKNYHHFVINSTLNKNKKKIKRVSKHRFRDTELKAFSFNSLENISKLSPQTVVEKKIKKKRNRSATPWYGTKTGKSCRKKRHLAVDRKCLKSCSKNRCKGRNRRCVCDGDCGLSCVKISQKCETVKLLFNGMFRISPYNTFGAKVVYTCHHGFNLVGARERYCQGDGYWSSNPPQCVPQSPDYASSILSYTKTCSKPPPIHFAINDANPSIKTFPLGTILTYTCSNGFKLTGGNQLTCVSQGVWVGPAMSCSAKRCGHPGNVPHGKMMGKTFMYPQKVSYTCMDGYERVGRSHITCQADGKWSGSPPKCKPKMCPELVTPINGSIEGQGTSLMYMRSYGSLVRYKCSIGYQLTGSEYRKCLSNGQWSMSEPYCEVIDCKSPGHISGGYYSGNSTKYGAIITYRCYSKATSEGETNTAQCGSDGRWSHPPLKCWDKCLVPEIINGTLDKVFMKGDLYEHGKSIWFNCSKGFVNTTDSGSLPTCHNGTWVPPVQCTPAPCSSRPPQIKNGIVRYHDSNHGSKAKCVCNTGYKLKGDSYIYCQHGQWKGPLPVCQIVFCGYPGKINHGKIYNVGVIGKYDYKGGNNRKHNDKIEYKCNKGYQLLGPSAATCVDGRWSPPDKPSCFLRQHPPLEVRSRV